MLNIFHALYTRMRWAALGPLSAIACLADPSVAQIAAIPGGSFVIGGEAGEEDERPAARIEVSPFFMDQLETTNAAYDSCVRAGVCSPLNYGNGACLMWDGRVFKRVKVPVELHAARQPAVCVTWQQARAYCRWRNGDLPTEAQWEYAALAANELVYAWGNDAPDKSKCAQPAEGKPRAVGSGPANAWRLHDMTGNVWEWTRDWYHRDYYAFIASKNPVAPQVGQFRAIRGGGWYSGPRQLRVKNRHWFPPEYGEVSLGFRCVYERARQ